MGRDTFRCVNCLLLVHSRVVNEVNSNGYLKQIVLSQKKIYVHAYHLERLQRVISHRQMNLGQQKNKF